MRAVLLILGVTDRKVWLADTFSGIPMPEKYPDVLDPVNDWTDRWSAGINEVRQTIARYGRLDEQIKFIEGPFAATLLSPAYGDIAIARLDADSYESTRNAIELIYPHIQPGGFIIIDDWQLPACKQAVVEYREKHDIKDPIRFPVIPEAETQNIRVQLEAFWQVGSYTENS